MSIRECVSGLLGKGRSNEEAHARFCALRNVPSAVTLVAFCVLEVLLSRRELGRTFPASNLPLVVEGLVGIAVCIKLFQIFRCFRERLIISIIMIRVTIGLVSAASPDLLSSFAVAIREGVLALWAVALLVSLSVLPAAVRSTRVAVREGGTSEYKRVRIFVIILLVLLLAGMLTYLVPSPR